MLVCASSDHISKANHMTAIYGQSEVPSSPR
jgi:hypothetical protein